VEGLFPVKRWKGKHLWK